MRKFLIFGIGGLALMSLGLVGCGGSEKESSGKVDIHNFSVNQVLKSASRNYQLTIDGEHYYLNIGATVAWPEKLGHADIAELQDSLASYTFGDSIYATPDEAITTFIDGVKELKDYFGEIQDIKVVDSIPLENPAFILRTNAEMIDVTPEYVTYAVTNSQYLGGAHGEVATLPFTYDLTNGKVMNASNFFATDSIAPVIDIIKSSLAAQLSTTTEHLAKMGIFQYDYAGVGYPYVKDGMLYVHYNPYDIAPYAAGAFDIPVNSVLIAPYLTPEAKELIGYDY